MKGEVIYLYAFDVANEIITSRVQDILSKKPFPFEIRMDRTLPKDMPLYKPLAIEPSALSAQLNGAPVRLLIRIYDVGVVTVMMRVAFETDALGGLMPCRFIIQNWRTGRRSTRWRWISARKFVTI